MTREIGCSTIASSKLGTALRDGRCGTSDFGLLLLTDLCRTMGFFVTKMWSPTRWMLPFPGVTGSMTGSSCFGDHKGGGFALRPVPTDSGDQGSDMRFCVMSIGGRCGRSFFIDFRRDLRRSSASRLAAERESESFRSTSDFA